MTPIRVLAVNVGSSSLRLDLWDIPGKSPQVVLEAGGIGGAQATVSVGGRAEGSAAFADHAAALDALLARLPPSVRLDRAGHRVVHGGPRYREPVWVDDRVLEDLDSLAELVPLHNPPALRAIRHLMQALPRTPQAAVFDTAFHASLPSHAVEYAVPVSWRDKGIRRYGFHGLACADAVFQLGSRLRERAVLLHLGAGCSATALLRGRSVDTTMGLTPLEGLVMGTRCGDLDPGIVPYLQREHQLSIDQIDQALNHECGLLGLSAMSGDMRTLLDQVDTPSVRRAIDVFCYRAAKAVGGMCVALGGCEQIIFTGGIGEHASPIRKWIIAQLEFFGARLDEEANSASAAVISDPRSAVSIHVVQIDEGRQIAMETARLARSDRPGTTTSGSPS
jgi:acetate kinase